MFRLYVKNHEYLSTAGGNSKSYCSPTHRPESIATITSAAHAAASHPGVRDGAGWRAAGAALFDIAAQAGFELSPSTATATPAPSRPGSSATALGPSTDGGAAPPSQADATGMSFTASIVPRSSLSAAPAHVHSETTAGSSAADAFTSPSTATQTMVQPITPSTTSVASEAGQGPLQVPVQGPVSPPTGSSSSEISQGFETPAGVLTSLGSEVDSAGGSSSATSADPGAELPSPTLTSPLVPSATTEAGASGESGATITPLAAEVPLAAASAVPNKIAIENAKIGNPRSEWGITGDGDTNIQGFATEISSNIGQTVDFKIATDSTNYRIDIYRLGYYGGDGARKVATINQSLTSAQIQPHPIVDMSIGLIDAGNWSVSASWQIPEDAVSGVYIAKLVRQDGTSGESHIPFVVRDDSAPSDVLFQTSDTTWQAYNAWGGASLYYGNVPVDPAELVGFRPPNCGCSLNAIGRASAVSYNRPFITNTSPVGGTHDFIFGVEHAAIQWLEQNGYDVSYISGVDATRNGAQLLDHKAFLSVGHDEYWSAEQRQNVEAARDAGVNIAFWGGNDMYWKVRWETSVDGSGTPYRTMVCYKETWGTSTDPSDIGTGTWRDPRFADPGQKPENALIGTMFTVDGYRQDTMTVPYDYSNLRFWRDTDIANLQPGQTYQMPKNLLGYEWNSDVENGFRPAGLINLSLSNVSVNSYLRDYGTQVGNADVTHSLTMYRAESGALVFSAGTVFWSWGLNAQHDGPATPTDRNVQQSMVNMFADMGIQPTTLQASLVLATQSTDTSKPTSTITSPIIGASFVEGQRVTVTGTAQDFGGGIIAGVEVSLDGGQSWFKATGRENWSYSWVVQASGTYTIMSRAVDDSVNMETPSAGKEVTVTLPSTSSLWTLGSKPAVETALDRDGVELGVRFQSTTAGTVSGIRFYKGFYNVGEHKVSLWTADGTLLASGISTGESLSGWQTVTFSSPIQISAGTTYVASYHSNGYYSVTNGYFGSTYTSGPLSVGQNGGVYAYTNTAGTFPGNSPGTGFAGTNYWVDVVFNPSTVNILPNAVDDSGFIATINTPSSIQAALLLANDNDPNGDAITIFGVDNAVNGTVSYNAQTESVTFTPTAGYTGPASFRYSISDGRGGIASATVSLTVKPQSTATGLFTASETPTIAANSDVNSVELGMKFVASSNGQITGVRYYKSALDTGTHTGSLWSSTGTLLARATFTNETASGWQSVTFSQPVSITAGTTYVASYHSNGRYASSPNFFTTSHTNGALTAPSSTTSGGNGVFAYGTSSLFPTASYNATNYWVDVLYERQIAQNDPPIAANDTGFSTNTGTAATIQAASLLANDNDPNGDPLTITGVDNAVNGTVAFNSQTNAVTFTPTAGYTGAASFRYSISDGRGGTASATVSLTVNPPPAPTTSLFSTSDTPTSAANTDINSVELGMKFVASANGQITGLRYYKSAQDTGTHTGSLWSSTGTLLARATFTNETASGWQTVNFSQPVSITAGTTYVASYHSNGRYASSPNYFTTSRTNGALTAPSSTTSGGNGVYAYGSASLFPTSSYNATNYWVDVLYQQQQSTQNSSPVAANDTGFSTNAGTAATIQAASLLSNDNDPDGDPLTITGVDNAVNGTVAFNRQTNAVTFTPTAGYTGAASFRYSISDGRGGTASATVSLTVNPADTTQNLFAATSTPTTLTVADNKPVNLGMKFQADMAGSITGIRFYKGASNTGPHTGYLWSSTGQLLASASFTNETASGWQSVNLSSEVQIQANTTYVVSYSSNGNYSATGGFFSSSVNNNKNLLAPSSASSGGNGLYAYGSAGLFPTSTFNSANYYVDVAFRPQLAA